MLFMANATDDMSRVEFSVRLLLIAFISMVFALIMRWHMRRSRGIVQNITLRGRQDDASNTELP